MTDRKVLLAGKSNKPDQIVRFKAVVQATTRPAQNIVHGQTLIFPDPVPSHTPRLSNRPNYRGVSQNPLFSQRSPGLSQRNLQSPGNPQSPRNSPGLSRGNSGFSSVNSPSGFSSVPPRDDQKSVSYNSYDFESSTNEVKSEKANKKGGKLIVAGMRFRKFHVYLI